MNDISPLQVIMREVTRALSAQLYYPALTVALSLPDICATLEIDRKIDGKSLRSGAGKRYKDWCNTYLQSKFLYLNAEDLWALRSGIMHNAMLSGHNLRYSRVIFLLPGYRDLIHENITGPNPRELGRVTKFPDDGVLQFDLTTFAGQILEGVDDWIQAHENDPVVGSNLPTLVRERPDGREFGHSSVKHPFIG